MSKVQQQEDKPTALGFRYRERAEGRHVAVFGDELRTNRLTTLTRAGSWSAISHFLRRCTETSWRDRFSVVTLWPHDWIKVSGFRPRANSKLKPDTRHLKPLLRQTPSIWDNRECKLPTNSCEGSWTGLTSKAACRYDNRRDTRGHSWAPRPSETPSTVISI